MKAAKFLGLAVLTVAVSGVAQAAPTTKKSVRVVAGATTLSTADKASITGLGADWKNVCGCSGEVGKPGYGFGAPVEHFGPPGQGFTNDKNWRGWLNNAGWADTSNGRIPFDSPLTPKGHNIPGPAFTITGTSPTG
jgi:hypothetical protein